MITMQLALKHEIKRVSKKQIEREQGKVRRAKKHFEKYEYRTCNPDGKTLRVPSNSYKYELDRHFNPKFCKRHANFLSKSIWNKVLEGSYKPKPALRHEIPKPDGSKRAIMEFTIPDTALANVINRRVQGRNLNRLSSISYAYRTDRKVLDALLVVRGFISKSKKFAIQIDFKKYFDSIPHAYIQEKLNNANQFQITSNERFVYSRFMEYQHAESKSYKKGIFTRPRKGIPQGSSISLFLANIASHDLDIALMNQPGRCVRFADDVIAVCSSYSQAVSIENCFIQHCERSGLEINEKKSPGIGIRNARHYQEIL